MWNVDLCFSAENIPIIYLCCGGYLNSHMTLVAVKAIYNQHHGPIPS